MAVFCWNSGGGIGWWLGTTCPQGSRFSRRCKPNTWGTEMFTRSTLVAATTLAFSISALAAPVTSFAPASVARAIDVAVQPDASGVILVQQRGRGGGGGGQRAAAGGNRGGGQRAAASGTRSGNFNSNNFHRDASNTRNAAEPECEYQSER